MKTTMHDPLLDKPPNRTVQATVVAVAVAALCAWYYWHSHHTAQATMPAAVPAVQPPPEQASIEHPIPAQTPAAAAQPLPGLNDSDQALADAVQQVGGAGARGLLNPESIVRHFVVTVDNLDRPKVASDKRPLAPMPGTLRVQGDELHATLDERNFERYASLTDTLQKLDVQRVAAVYVHFYPLLQTAYQDLGYPNGYFNDRMVKAIDSLLATPQPPQPIELTRPNVMYVFADPALEALPAGEKVLLRMGPDNAAVVKGKLRELRAIITAAAAKR